MIIKQKAVQTIHELSTLTDFQKIELQNQQTTASKGMIAETIRYLHDNQKNFNRNIDSATDRQIFIQRYRNQSNGSRCF